MRAVPSMAITLDQGSISSDTFEVGGVQYTVLSVGFLKGSANDFELTVTSPLPFDSFALTLGSTELLSSNAIVTTVSDGTQTELRVVRNESELD